MRKVVCAGDIAQNGLSLTADQCDCLSQLLAGINSTRPVLEHVAN
ncbi:hypothetical protein ACJ2_23790 [Pantoea sp. QMID2]|nr:hypothetical protein ACJ3_27390 [Pantoea sp. QMID3]GME42804.1 hypothetical protein ACJ1_31310 [Pantoea sp. QMID1]GME57837.1 hypothetical protein ACJ4_27820 [Pantoea sp. QMID4]GME57874.1 hypothetical protein ACJ2_23790 [Pantoea sp. QMID2]